MQIAYLDEYNRILEMPTFGNSENHAPLQIVDLLCPPSSSRLPRSATAWDTSTTFT
jgi:hypothetical protein